MDPRYPFAVAELVLGALMAGLGGWQYIVSGPLPGVLGRSLRPGRKLEDLPPRRWQLSGAAQGLFGLGFLMFGASTLLQATLDEGGRAAVRTAGSVAWLVAIVIVFLMFTRYRSTT